MKPFQKQSDIFASVRLVLSDMLSFVFYRMVGCTPFLVISYFYLWYVPPFSGSRFIWYLGFYCLYQTLITVSMHALSELCAFKKFRFMCVRCFR